jgi:hypothetical protein
MVAMRLILACLFFSMALVQAQEEVPISPFQKMAIEYIEKLNPTAVLKNYRTYMNSGGEKIFKAVTWVRDKVGLNPQKRCELLLSEVNTSQRPALAQLRGLFQGVDRLRSLDQRDLELTIREMFNKSSIKMNLKDVPFFVRGLTRAVQNKPDIECFVLSFSDKKKWVFYGILALILAIFLYVLWALVSSKFHPLLRLIMPLFFLSLMSITHIYLLFLILQPEIDPIFQTMMAYVLS